MARSPRPIFTLFMSFISCPIFSPIVTHNLDSTQGLRLKSALLDLLLTVLSVGKGAEEERSQMANSK